MRVALAVVLWLGGVFGATEAWPQSLPAVVDTDHPSRSRGVLGQSVPHVEGSDGGTGSTPVDPVAMARVLAANGHAAEALALLHRLPPRIRLQPSAMAARAIAMFVALAPALEPEAVRALAPAAQTELTGIITELSRWVPAHPEDAQAALILGRAQMVHGDLTAAADTLDTAVHARPADPIPWNDRAMVLVALHRLPEAEHCLDEATSLAPQDPEPWDNLGAVRLARGASNRAADAFRRAADLRPQEARYLSDLGSALLAAGDATEAVQTYQRAAALDPSNAVVAANLGYGLSLANRLDEALTELRRAVTLNPGSVTAWNNLGLVLARRGDREAAAEAFHRAMGIDASDPRARANLDALGQP